MAVLIEVRESADKANSHQISTKNVGWWKPIPTKYIYTYKVIVCELLWERNEIYVC